MKKHKVSIKFVPILICIICGLISFNYYLNNNKNTSVYYPDNTAGETTTPTKRTVTFMVGMTEYYIESVNDGEPVERPEDPNVYDNQAFETWCTDPAATNAYDFSTPVTSDITLYAKFKTKTYRIIYDPNGGDVTPGEGVKTHGLAYTIISYELEKDGFTFKGWNTKADGSGTDYAPGSQYTENADLTLYAKWEAQKTTYLVTFTTYDADGGSGFESVTVESGQTVSEPTNNLPSGYKLNGWYTDMKFSETSKFDFNTPITKNTTLYAKWEREQVPPKTYRIKYDANGGLDAPIDGEKKEGQSYTISDKVPTICDGTFVGWNTNADGSGKSYNKGATYSDDANLTLYAQYTANSKYTIKYDANGGEGSADDVEFDSLTSITFAKDGFTKSGFILKSWNTQKDGKGTKYEAGQPMKICLNGSQKNLTLYAQWKKIEDIDIEAVLREVKHKIDGNYIIINPNEDPKKITSGYENVGSNEEYISTGDKLKINNQEYIFVVLGDTNGDGVINSADLFNLQKHMKELEELKDAYLKAADADMNSEIKSNDLYVVKIFLLQGINPLK